MKTSVKHGLFAGCAAALALSLAATAANAAILTYDTSPVGGPPVGVDDYSNTTNPVATGGTIVDLGGGNHAVSLPVVITPFNNIPYQTLFFGFHTWSPFLNPGAVEYDWQLNSFDVWVSQDTLYRGGFWGGVTGTTMLLANQWTTINVNFGSTFRQAIFGPSASGPGTVLIDNVNYTLLGSHAVPEPATWAMLIMGFGLIGASMRRRRTLAPA